MKKLLLISSLVATSLVSYSANYNLNTYGTLGFNYSYGPGITLTSGVSFEYPFNLSKGIDLGVGPEVGLNFTYNYLATDTHRFSVTADITGRLDTYFDFNKINGKVIKKIKNKVTNSYEPNLYVGFEVGLGLGYSNLTYYYYKSGFQINPIFKLHVGTKLNDKLRIGGFVGYGKGNIGVELGYTIK